MLLLDEAWSKVDPGAAAAAGYGGIIGYVSQDATGKNITRVQVDDAHAHGLAVGLVYEYHPSSPLGGTSQGRTDAGIALAHASALGAPKTTALYVAIDFDVQPDQLTIVGSYVAAFFASVTLVGFRSGVYGGLRICQYLPTVGYRGLLWQTYAWSAGHWAPGVAVRQVQNNVHVAGVAVDKDISAVSDWGQWAPGVPVVPPTGGDSLVTHWTTVKEGSSGQAVKNAQGLLIAHGYSVGSPGNQPDGSFGPMTDRSTRALQQAHGLSVDGEFGPHTASVALLGVDVA